MKLKTIKNLNLKDKKVLLRVDFNVSIKNNKILDDSRIKAVLPTINYLKKQKAKIILISHLGDPFKIKKAEKIKNYSLKPISKYLKCPLVKNYKEAPKIISQIKPGQMILLENLRFYSGEKKNDLKFAKELALLADIYINEAFSVSHRNHASVSAITNYLPSYAGFLLEKEVKSLSQILESPKHPFIVLMGGIKVSTKLPVIKNLLKMADKILIGGALANTFFKAEKINLSQSVYEKEMVKEAKRLLKNKKIVLPIDVKINLSPSISQERKFKTKTQNLKLEELKKIKNFKIFDIGQETIKIFTQYLKSAKMIVWNGPMGYFEKKPFNLGTKKIIESILKNKKAKIFIGGGETITALRQLRINKEIFINQRGYQYKSTGLFISTGGGAMLEFLSGKILPGIKPLLLTYN